VTSRWNPAYGPSDEARTRYLRLDGQVPLHKREELIQRFNSDASVSIMLLTTRVGGLGINLTGADTVIFVEHDWNPQVRGPTTCWGC
jgi:SNF2 family DNA or RNA helicase